MQVSQASALSVRRPVMSEDETWEDYWRTQSQPWRTEPEISDKRQQELAQCLAIKPDIEQGRFPFSAQKLSRADLEWLLDRQQLASEELDLRGADLRKLHLHNLPLGSIRGGLAPGEWELASDKHREMAAVRLERTDLRGLHLIGANLCGAHLEEADLRGAHLEGANLCGASLAMANLSGAHLEGANLREAHLEGNASFPRAAHLRGAYLNSFTNLSGIILGNEKYGFAPVADVHWNGANLAAIDWSQVARPGDEYVNQWRLPGEYLNTIRACRQLAAALRKQGMYEQADQYLYRAHVNQHHMILQRALLPVVLRIFVRERMPLPKVLLRLEERYEGELQPTHPLLMALLRLLPVSLLFLVITFYQPLITVILLLLAVVPFIAIMPILRKRAGNPQEYGRAQRMLLPPGLRPQQQRRREQWQLLLGFLLGTPKWQLPELLKTPEIGLNRQAVLQRLHKKRPELANILVSLVVLLLLFDDSIRRYGSYCVSLFLYGFTGFGYKLTRAISCYVFVILGFMLVYQFAGPFTPDVAISSSLAAFHNPTMMRGIFLDDALSFLAGVESIIGLIMEISFISMFARRYFSK